MVAGWPAMACTSSQGSQWRWVASHHPPPHTHTRISPWTLWKLFTHKCTAVASLLYSSLTISTAWTEPGGKGTGGFYWWTSQWRKVLWRSRAPLIMTGTLWTSLANQLPAEGDKCYHIHQIFLLLHWYPHGCDCRDFSLCMIRPSSSVLHTCTWLHPGVLTTLNYYQWSQLVQYYYVCRMQGIA